jgi:alpha-ketoglutarate-dependent taurine dioxygenase
MPSPIEVRPLHPSVGAEVRGVDLRKPLAPGVFDAIQQAWLKHHVLVFPGQEITDAEQVAFSRHFGRLEEFPMASVRSGAQKEIFRVANTDADGNLLPSDSEVVVYLSLTQDWHIDSSYRKVASKGSILHGIEVTEEGGETWLVNLADVLAALPPDLKMRIEGRTAIHDFLFARSLRPQLSPLPCDEAAKVPPTEHSLIRHHEVTGVPSIFLSPVYISAISGLSPVESRALVDDLTAFAEQDRFVYRHKWTRHDVLMWDNRSLMHAGRAYDAARQRRVMHRTSIAGGEG